MPPRFNVQEWVQSAQEGEQTAWTCLYQLYNPALYSIALEITGNSASARDKVHDTFITAYLKINQLKNAKAFGGWLKKILIHKCYRSFYCNRIFERLDSIPHGTDRWWDDEFNRKLDLLSDENRLYSGLTRLSERLRSVVLLRYFSKFESYEAIAAILSIPLGTVRSRLNQAKSKLQDYWKRNQDPSNELFKETAELNQFYFETLSGMHNQDTCKNRFISHLKKDIRIIILGKTNIGTSVFEQQVIDDREHGSWLKPVEIVSSGNISIIEFRHFNSVEYPSHCPKSSVQLLYRTGSKVREMNLYF